MLKSFLNHPYTFWAVLCLPAIPMVAGLTSGDPKAVHQLLHPTGEFAARFMIIAMMITPLMMLLKGWRGPRWLMKRRRYLGVAAFGYAALHTVLYLIDEGAGAFAGGELAQTYIWTGWLAFAIFVPLAVTSTDGWVRQLGPRWKTLQRFVYGAAVLTLVHWAALHDWGGIGAAMVHFVPLAALEGYRLWSNMQRRSLRLA
ncbi:protein-methionine-sulfoxide reductase heme-binding subunit MsrQ [Antarctobacter heliothermus]|uniref:Protein-methionine-sulfoxide reductase heme-binding subunit MsrQ n=1 Tax=Antarctobacter heliothermus TaxID=74033 RepID=A0A222E8S2_9RHOB|nr:ferric reductase-like transmembrane domain-containing protein [Antarctobacter heliothermus]ASP22448.1 protein-methionine-sulfoxide reductase heme-binding subunit MsrQ [Antarctobacter heliothermus]